MSECNPKALSLPHGIMDDALVRSKIRSVPIDKASCGRNPFRSISLQIAGIIIVRDKADFFAVRLLRNRNSRFLCHSPDLILMIISHRHQRVCKLFLCQAVQRIGLILRCGHRIPDRIASIGELLHPGIMSR